VTDQHAPVMAPRGAVDARSCAVRVIGLDLSLTATGVAIIAGIDGHLASETTTLRSSPSGTGLAARERRADAIAAAVEMHIAGAAMVVVEGPSLGSRDGHVWDRAGLWWHVVRRCMTYAPVVEIPPATVKRWATGKGNADKATVAASLARLWPDVEPANDNEFDALALATIGAQRLGLPVPSRAHHADALAKVDWPPVPTVEVTR
jgi:crossover junction endodeoxyribonuclease RuvC